MDDRTLAYLAGCLDSDGYFTIRKDSYPIKTGRGITYHEEIGLRQVTPVVPYLLRATFGGNVYLRRAYPIQGRPLYSWTVLAVKAASAAEVLLPYLRIKGDQARILIELRAVKDANGRRRVTDQEHDAREALRMRVRELNGRIEEAA